MPYDWVEPEIFMIYKGITIYHVYKNDFIQEGRRQYWYTTDLSGSEDDDYAFDVRFLSTYSDHLSHREIIMRAIDLGELEIPE